MGTGASRQKIEIKHAIKHVQYWPNKNSLAVVYGANRTLADCVFTNKKIPGVKINLEEGYQDSVCMIKKLASIHNSGRMELSKACECVLRMEIGAKIRVGVNARLNIHGTLLMERNARLIVEPGVTFTIFDALHITDAATLTVTNDSINYRYNRLSETLSINERVPPSVRYDDPRKMVTWCDADKDFLVQLLCFFRFRQCVPDELILPLLFPHCCQRYGVLMLPAPYKVPTELMVKNLPWCHK